MAAPAAQLGGSRGVHLPDRVVELAHAPEPRGEGHVGGSELGRLEQHTSGLGALGAGECQRPRAELLGQEPGEMARGVADAGGEPLHAVAVDHPVGDQPHRTAGDVGGDVPVGAAGRGVGKTALAGAVPGRLRGRGGGVEGDVLVRRGARGAGRTAVDAGGAHGDEEHPVEPPIAALHRPVAGLGVQVHR